MNAQNKPVVTNDKSDEMSNITTEEITERQASVLDRMLEQGGLRGAGAGGSFSDAFIFAWSGRSGVLSDGRQVRLGASCLLRPEKEDRVLVWSGVDEQVWVLNVLHRVNEDAPFVLTTSGPMMLESPRVGIKAKVVHISSEDFLSSTRNRHAVERTRTEIAKVRVVHVGTDIRRATTVDDEIKGTFMQRTGTWVSSTVREARLRARTFLFD